MSGMCNNAIDYLCGRGVPKDAKKAAYWNQKAAEMGEAKAQFNLAEQYRTGDGVDQDISKAIYWYKESAQKGHRMAQTMCVALGVNEV